MLLAESSVPPTPIPAADGDSAGREGDLESKQTFLKKDYFIIIIFLLEYNCFTMLC